MDELYEFVRTQEVPIALSKEQIESLAESGTLIGAEVYVTALPIFFFVHVNSSCLL